MIARTRTEAFWEWAEGERERRDLNWYRVEKKANLGNGTISKRARDELPPTQTTIKAIAKVFDMPREFVYQKAGMLPPHIIGEPSTDEIVHYYRALTSKNRDILLGIARTLHEKQEDYSATNT